MLELAYLHKDELQKKYGYFTTKHESKFYSIGGYNQFSPEIGDNNWKEIQMVSVYDGKVIGFITCRVNWITHNVETLGILSLSEISDVKRLLGIDIQRFFKLLLFTHNFNKINWSVVIGNPVEKNYDKLCERMNGRIVGIKEADVKLTDGKIYDRKIYEVMKRNIPQELQIDAFLELSNA